MLATAVVSTAALQVAGPPTSRVSNENHAMVTPVLKPGPFRGAAGELQENQRCWIFMHLQKSGGSTIKNMLNRKRRRSEYSIYDSKQWKRGDDFSSAFGRRLARGSTRKIVAGGYPEALRRLPSVESSCRFFTMFRHPISRMVSAYFFCQLHEEDSACASGIVRARHVDLLTFAKHWSNFAVRQFALSFVPAEDVMA